MSEGQACPQDILEGVARTAERDVAAALSGLHDLIETYPRDGRLHFLEGSLLAGERRYEEAQASMVRAVEAAPAFHLARYQLGLLQLSSGDAAAAAQTWGPLVQLDAGDPLRLFAEGMLHMARDEFDAARALLNQGLEANVDNPVLSRDVMLILEGMDSVRREPDAEPTSSAHLLLQQYAAGQVKH